MLTHHSSLITHYSSLITHSSRIPFPVLDDRIEAKRHAISGLDRRHCGAASVKWRLPSQGRTRNLTGGESIRMRKMVVVVLMLLVAAAAVYAQDGHAAHAEHAAVSSMMVQDWAKQK